MVEYGVVSKSVYHFSIDLARFKLETDDTSGRTCILMKQAVFSSSDNSSVYKYGQTDGSSVQTNYLDNSSC